MVGGNGGHKNSSSRRASTRILIPDVPFFGKLGRVVSLFNVDIKSRCQLSIHIRERHLTEPTQGRPRAGDEDWRELQDFSTSGSSLDLGVQETSQ